MHIKFLKGCAFGLLISFAVSSLAIIGGGIIQHNHSGATSGGATLVNTTLNNPTVLGTLSSPSIGINTPSGTNANLQWFNNSALRWQLYRPGGTDNLVLDSNNVSNVITFNNSSGAITTASSISATGSVVTPAIIANQAVLGQNLDSASVACIRGTTKAVRIGASGVLGSIDAVDSGCVTSFAPLQLQGTTVTLSASAGGGSLVLGTNGSFTSSKACTSGYTRVGPNFCMRNVSANITPTMATACTAQTLPDTLSDATALQVNVMWDAISNNAVANRFNQAFFWKDASCTVGGYLSEVAFREFTATAAGTTIGTISDGMVIPITTTTTFRTTMTNAGGNGNANLRNIVLIGYYD